MLGCNNSLISGGLQCSWSFAQHFFLVPNRVEASLQCVLAIAFEVFGIAFQVSQRIFQEA